MLLTENKGKTQSSATGIAIPGCTVRVLVFQNRHLSWHISPKTLITVLTAGLTNKKKILCF